MVAFETLNSRYGNENVKIVAGDNNLPKIVLTINQSRVEVYLHGANVTSFVTSDGKEVLYMSEKAIIAESSKIRGGVPICFPQFGPGELVQHGFARQSDEWVITDSSSSEQSASVTLTLRDTRESREMWNQNQFRCDYTITLTSSDQLILNMRVENQNKKDAFSFTAALHTYFNVPDVNQTAVKGFHNLSYSDKVTKTEEKQNQELVEFKGEVDRVYYNIPQLDDEQEAQISILFNKNQPDNKSGILIKQRSNGFSDCVVWNPWIEKTKGLTDMPDEDFTRFICAEAAVVGEPVVLQPSSVWNGQVQIQRQ